MTHRLNSETVTNGIRICAAAVYSPDQSRPTEGRYVFAYRIMIHNEGQLRVRLLSRHWIIINANGDRQEVEGPGVVGLFPSLAPGESFEYTSFCPLDTDWGTMEGTYRMQRSDGAQFDAVIGRFYLAVNAPHEVEEV